MPTDGARWMIVGCGHSRPYTARLHRERGDGTVATAESRRLHKRGPHRGARPSCAETRAARRPRRRPPPPPRCRQRQLRDLRDEHASARVQLEDALSAAAQRRQHLETQLAELQGCSGDAAGGDAGAGGGLADDLQRQMRVRGAWGAPCARPRAWCTAACACASRSAADPCLHPPLHLLTPRPLCARRHTRARRQTRARSWRCLSGSTRRACRRYCCRPRRSRRSRTPTRTLAALARQRSLLLGRRRPLRRSQAAARNRQRSRQRKCSRTAATAGRPRRAQARWRRSTRRRQLVPATNHRRRGTWQRRCGARRRRSSRRCRPRRWSASWRAAGWSGGGAKRRATRASARCGSG